MPTDWVSPFVSSCSVPFLLLYVVDISRYAFAPMAVQASKGRPKSMVWIVFVAGAVLSWGAYGALLHQGQTQLGNPLKALLCVGVAYFLIGVIVPVIGLSAQGGLSGFNTSGLTTATIAGALGAAGAACIIYSFRF